jgi:hypothetical protein
LNPYEGEPRKKSNPKKPVSEKTRAEDERLRRGLENADPEKFEWMVKPLFRSPKSDSQ